MPAELTPVLVCEAMGWSWQELLETPVEVVADVVTLLSVRGKVNKLRRKIEEGRK